MKAKLQELREALQEARNHVFMPLRIYKVLHGFIDVLEEALGLTDTAEVPVPAPPPEEHPAKSRRGG